MSKYVESEKVELKAKYQIRYAKRLWRFSMLMVVRLL